MAEDLGLRSAANRPWTHGSVTAFVERHKVAWEVVGAILTLLYVALAFAQDQGDSAGLTAAIYVVAAIFIFEFSVRFYDSPSRVEYLRKHWLDIVTCIPVIGELRILRLLRLLAFLRLGAAMRAFGIGVSASERIPGGAGLWLLAPTLLLVWVAAAYGYYTLEHGLNPKINDFGDAMYFAFVTASTVGYGDVTPVTQAGKILTGLVIFMGIGLLGFASAQLTAKLLPQRNEMAELKATLDRQERLLEDLVAQLARIEPERGRI